MPIPSAAVRLILAALAIALAAITGLGGPKTVLIILFVALLPSVMAGRAGNGTDRNHPAGPERPIENGRPPPDR